MLFSLYIKTLHINYKNINILKVVQQVNPVHSECTYFLHVLYRLFVQTVGYRIMLQAIKLLIHVSSSQSLPLWNLITTTSLFLLYAKSKTCFCAKNSFIKQFFKYQNTIPVVEGYFSTMFLSLCNTSSPHRCVISKSNSSKRTLQLNRPVILDQGVKCVSSYPHTGTGMKYKGREKKTKMKNYQKTLVNILLSR